MPPRPIIALLVADLLLGVAHLANAVLGRGFGRLDRLVDMDQEGNLPTWFASMQWGLASGLLAIVALRLHKQGAKAALPIGLLSVMLMGLSLDETARIHEKVSSLLGDGTGIGKGDRMGLWLPVLAVPLVVAFCSLVRLSKPALACSPEARRLLIVGWVSFVAAAAVVEPVALALLGKVGPLLVFLEETLELASVSVLVWGGYLLATASGLRLEVVTMVAESRSPTAGDDRHPEQRLPA